MQIDKDIFNETVTSLLNTIESTLDKHFMQTDEVRILEDLKPIGFNFVKLGYGTSFDYEHEIEPCEFNITINHPLCGCASIVIQKNYLSVYNKVVQTIILQKGKVIYGEERKCTRTYEMDVQISYRIHSKV